MEKIINSYLKTFKVYNLKEIRNNIEKCAGDFDKIAQDSILKKNIRKHEYELKTILDLIQPIENPRILDIGGGMGVNLFALRRFNKEIDLVLLDRFDEYKVGTEMGLYNNDTMKRFEKYSIKVIEQDIVNNPQINIADKKFDVICLIDVIEHLPSNPVVLLKEIFRLVKPGGYLFLGGPNLFGISELSKLVKGKHPYMDFELWMKNNYYSHFREYTEKEYKEIVNRAGFKIIYSTKLSIYNAINKFNSPLISGIIVSVVNIFLSIFSLFKPVVYVIGKNDNEILD
jgi:2-polyprenyl-3-methyl-5-hydroxy-6-metoxy-1,4-benzoquinol methylase